MKLSERQGTDGLPGLLADLMAISAFSLLAHMAHHSLSFEEWLHTVAQFGTGVLLGWLVVHGLQRSRGRLPLFTQGVWVWALAVVVGLVEWALYNGRVPHWSFVIVATVMSALLLFGWRLLLTLTSKD